MSHTRGIESIDGLPEMRGGSGGSVDMVGKKRRLEVSSCSSVWDNGGVGGRSEIAVERTERWRNDYGVALSNAALLIRVQLRSAAHSESRAGHVASVAKGQEQAATRITLTCQSRVAMGLPSCMRCPHANIKELRSRGWTLFGWELLLA